MINIETKSGFSCKIDERIINDWRLIKLIDKVENGDSAGKVSATAELVSFLLGGNVEKLEAHIAKNNDGFIPMDAMSTELFDIISNAKIKNS